MKDTVDMTFEQHLELEEADLALRTTVIQMKEMITWKYEDSDNRALLTLS